MAEELISPLLALVRSQVAAGAGDIDRALALAERAIEIGTRAADADLKAHLAAVHRFMPGMRLERRGDVRHCQWHVLADWVALGTDGQERGRGTNLFVLDADGRIAEVTGFWAG